MKYFPLSLLFVLLASCSAYKMVPFKGEYPKQPYAFTSQLPSNQVWQRTIDFVALNGFPVKIIDKENGLIISERSVLRITTEQAGKLLDTSALVVVARGYNVGKNDYAAITKQSDVTGEWNIQIRQVDGLTYVTTNIVNLKYQLFDSYYHTYKEQVLSAYHSTGNFERTLTGYLSTQ